jgi:aminocarboxymuconate-semialdehyde decarboxylase
MSRATNGTAPVVDVHAHLVPDGVLEIDPRFRVSPDPDWGALLHYGDRFLGPLPEALTQVDVLLAEMDQRRTDVCAVASASWLTCYWAEPSLGRDVARGTNELIAGAVAAHPDRLVGLAGVPLQDVALAVDELEHAVGRLGMRGVAIGTNVNGTYLDDPVFEPFFAAAARLGVPVFLHPDEVAAADKLREYYLTRLIGNPHEVALSLARLVLGGVLERVPELKVCVPLGGGSIPFVLGRIENGWRARSEARMRLQSPPADSFRRCYFDTILHSRASLRFLLDVIPPEQVLLGSDRPWDMGEADPLGALEQLDELPAADRERIAGANAAALLHIQTPKTEESERGDV